MDLTKGTWDTEGVALALLMNFSLVELEAAAVRHIAVCLLHPHYVLSADSN
jgi:hypothetical protein